MSVYKPCWSRSDARYARCSKKRPGCKHPWWLGFKYRGRYHRRNADDFAAAHGGTGPVTTKEEAKHWEAQFKFIIRSGGDPMRRADTSPKQNTLGDCIDDYIEKVVDVVKSKGQDGKRGKCLILKGLIGHYPMKALETVAPAEEVREHYKNAAVATANRYLAELRAITNWALDREDIGRTPFRRHGIHINTKLEVQRSRRVSDEEERKLLDACDGLDKRRPGASKLTWETVSDIRKRAAAGESQKSIAARYGLAQGFVSQVVNGLVWREGRDVESVTGKEMRDRIIGALETGCRMGELLKMQNRHVDWENGWIEIPRENAKSGKSRFIPFRGSERLTEILKRRKFLGPNAYVFGAWQTGKRVVSFRTAWESVVLLANGIEPVRNGRKGRRTDACREQFKRIDLHFHDFRHEALSRFGEGGMLLSELQELAGHQNPQTTKRYEHVSSRRLADAMQRARERRAQQTSAAKEASFVAVGGR